MFVFVCAPAHGVDVYGHITEKHFHNSISTLNFPYMSSTDSWHIANPLSGSLLSAASVGNHPLEDVLRVPCPWHRKP